MSVEKLKEQLKKEVEDGLINFGITWGEGACSLTADQRAEAVLGVIEEGKKWNALTDEEKMIIQIKQSYEYLSNVIGLCQTDIKNLDFDDEKSMEDMKVRSKIFCGIEAAMLLLGNWVDQDEKMEIRRRRPK